MKKIITAAAAALTAAALTCSLMPANAADVIYIEENPDTWGYSAVQGDTNLDSEVTIADAVALQGYLMKERNPERRAVLTYANELMRYDLNYDGFIDAFDMVVMRKLLVEPESALTMSFTVDKVSSGVISSYNSDENEMSFGNLIDGSYREDTIISDTSALSSRLHELLTDEDEIQRYIDKYDDGFFETHDLSLDVAAQSCGEGVFTRLGSAARILKNTGDGLVNVIVLFSGHTYTEDIGLYPKTETLLLMQAELPKQLTDSAQAAGILDLSFLESDRNDQSYTSPDGNTEIVITQEAFLFNSSGTVYLKTEDGGYIRVSDIWTDDGAMPFESEGEWTENDDGAKVYGNGSSYSITWGEDSITLRHVTEYGGEWQEINISYDGRLLSRTIPGFPGFDSGNVIS
ncbi:MAG: dockerin type I repeat-containing protein [Ruminococcus sp.]|nr:dockerin type I repeat-containing protein [Ruminococcus sp.]